MPLPPSLLLPDSIRYRWLTVIAHRSRCLCGSRTSGSQAARCNVSFALQDRTASHTGGYPLHCVGAIVPPGTSIRCCASLRMCARSAVSKSGKTALRSRLTGTAVRLADRSGWRRAYHEGLRRDLRIAAKLYGTIEQNKVRLSLSLQCVCQPS